MIPTIRPIHHPRTCVCESEIATSKIPLTSRYHATKTDTTTRVGPGHAMAAIPAPSASSTCLPNLAVTKTNATPTLLPGADRFNYTITVTNNPSDDPGNTAPSNIMLSATQVREAVANGSPIGTLSATDAEGGALTYTLTNDAAGRFEIRNGSLTLTQMRTIIRDALDLLKTADEPAANLDDAHASGTLELLRTQALANGATLVVASHDARVRPLLPHAFALPARPGRDDVLGVAA